MSKMEGALGQGAGALTNVFKGLGFATRLGDVDTVFEQARADKLVREGANVGGFFREKVKGETPAMKTGLQAAMMEAVARGDWEIGPKGRLRPVGGVGRDPYGSLAKAFQKVEGVESVSVADGEFTIVSSVTTKIKQRPRGTGAVER